jgi:hypothetical protein
MHMSSQHSAVRDQTGNKPQKIAGDFFWLMPEC